MKQTDETKKTGIPADGAEAPEAPKPGETLSDVETDAVSGGLGMLDLPEPAFIRPSLIVPDFDTEFSI